MVGGGKGRPEGGEGGWWTGCQRKRRVPRQFLGADGQPRGAKLCQLFASYFMPSPPRFTSPR